MPDFDYGNARLHAMKSRLLTQRQLEDLTRAGTLPGMVAILMKTAYQPAIEYAIARTTGIEMIQEALRQDFLREVSKIRSFYKHDAGEMVSWVMRGYDIYNLKTILRSLGKHALPTEIMAAVMPVSELDEHILAELSRASAPRAAIDMLASMSLPYAAPLLKLRAEHPGADTSDMELMLDRWYYQAMDSYLKDEATEADLLVELLALEADLTNLTTALRFAHVPAERKALGIFNPPGSSQHSPIGRLFVGPGKLPFASLERVSEQDSIPAAVELLAGTPYMTWLEAGLQLYRHSGRLSDLEKQLRRYRLEWMRRQITRDPLGIGVFLGYTALKTNEINNLHWIAQSILAGLKPDAIRAGIEFIA